MAKTCYKKLGSRWYGPQAVQDLIDKNTKRADLLANGKSTASIDKEMQEILDNGIQDIRDANGEINLDEIFERKGSSTNRTVTEEILDRLEVKATALDVSNKTKIPTSTEVWAKYKDQFEAAGITVEQVIEKLDNIIDNKSGATTSQKQANVSLDRSTFIKKWWPKFLGAINSSGISKKLFGEIAEESLLRDARVQAVSEMMARSTIRLNKLVNKSFINPTTKKRLKLTEAQRKNVLQAIKGKETFDETGIAPDLAKEIRRGIEDVRLDLDVLSSRLQAQLGTSEGIIGIIENNKGQYVPYTYKAFTNDGWADTVFENGTSTPSKFGRALVAGARRVRRPQIIKTIARQEESLKKLKAEQANYAPNTKKYSDIQKQIDNKTNLLNKNKAAVASEAGMNEFLRDELLALSEKGKGVNSGTSDGKTNNKIFEKRENKSDEIRAFWGEVSDMDNVLDSYISATMKMSTQLVNMQYQNKVSEHMLEGGMFTTDAAEGKKLGWKPLDLSNGNWAALRNNLIGTGAKNTTIYVPGDLATLFTSMFTPTQEKTGAINFLLNMLGAYTSTFKVLATVFNVPSQAVNVTSNVALAVKSGQIGRGYGKAMATSLRILVGYDNVATNAVKRGRQDTEQEKADRNYIDEIRNIAIANNIKDSTLLLEIVDGMTDKEFQEGIDKLLSKAGVGNVNLAKGKELVSKVFGTLYQAGDEIWKLADMVSRLDSYAKILGDVESFRDLKDPKVKQQVIELATQETRIAFPNYNELWQVFKANKVSNLVGMFVSYPAEMIRTTGASLAREYRHMKGKGLPKGLTQEQIKKIQAKGTKELALNIMLGAIGSSFISAGLSALGYGGLGDDEEDLIRDVYMQSYLNNAVIERDGPDHIIVRPLDYMAPQSMLGNIISPIGRGIAGRTEKQMSSLMAESLGALVSPFLTPDVGPDLAIKLLGNNKDGYGTEIADNNLWNVDVSTLAGQYIDFFKGIPPGEIANWRRRNKLNIKLEELHTLRDETGINEREKIADLNKKIKNLEKLAKSRGIPYYAGHRSTVIHIDQANTYEFLKRSENIKSAKGTFKDHLENPNEINVSKLDKALEKTRALYKQELNKARSVFRRMKRVYPDRDLEGALTGKYLFSKNRSELDSDISYFSKEEIKYIMSEREDVPKYTPTKYKERTKGRK